MTERQIKWVLFAVMCVTLPVLYYMFVVGGTVSLLGIAAMTVTGGVWGFKLFNGVHLLLYGALFYWIAKGIARVLGMLSEGWKLGAFAALAIGCVALSFLPLYGIGHHEAQLVNLYQFLARGLRQGF